MTKSLPTAIYPLFESLEILCTELTKPQISGASLLHDDTQKPEMIAFLLQNFNR